MGRAFEYRRASKEKRWDKMAKIFPKLSKAITMAAKEGSSDPEVNSKLRIAIQNAKSENMPKNNIQSAIDRATGKDSESIKEINYEGKGPHGVMIFVECATDNTNRSVANIKTYFNKSGGQILPSGSIQFLFDHKSIFEVEINKELDLEEIQLSLMDFGMEEFEINDDTIYITADQVDFGKLSKGIEDLGLKIKKATLERIPNNPQVFKEEELRDIESLIDNLEQDEDVQNVFTNVYWSS